MAGINHDTAARLIGLTPGDLESLVKSGEIRRSGRDDYALHVLVQDYIGYLKAAPERAEFSPKQLDIAEHIDLSERAVREFLESADIDHKKSSLSEIRIAYIRRQREIAAGRAVSEGGMDLGDARTRLARVQADKIEMENEVNRGLLIPADQLEPKLLAAFTVARETWIDAVPRLARELPADPGAREVMLLAEFEGFLHQLANWAHADVEDDE